jgi:hypothetical protein
MSLNYRGFFKDLEGGSKDIFNDLLVEEILKPIGTSPASQVSRRTYDGVQQPFTGWGMTYLRDDVARITQFLNVDGGQVNGEMLFDTFEFDAAMQRDPGDRGLDPLDDFKYNNGFWAHEIKSFVGCPADIWVPFMSGSHAWLSWRESFRRTLFKQHLRVPV